jgi:hypothetical protein
MSDVFVVIWHAFNAKPLAVFQDEAAAMAYRDQFKRDTDVLMKRIGLSGDERVDVHTVAWNPVYKADG